MPAPGASKTSVTEAKGGGPANVPPASQPAQAGQAVGQAAQATPSAQPGQAAQAQTALAAQASQAQAREAGQTSQAQAAQALGQKTATAPGALALQGALPAPPDVKEPPKDAQRLPSGLASKVLVKGRGKVKPTLNDVVKVHYTGWTTDGVMFDSSVVRNQPAVFVLRRVIPGWSEGVQLMVEGEKRRLWIPEELAYKGRPGPQGMLVFDVELLEIVRPPETPKDVKAPPKDAKKTPSGLAYKVLRKGKGTKHPTKDSRVTVHYTGWTTDGKMFDSSVMRGMPATFPLKRVIPGWTEGVQLMVEGDKFRFWIPEELAYKGRPGPQGMLVFDVELLGIAE